MGRTLTYSVNKEEPGKLEHVLHSAESQAGDCRHTALPVLLQAECVEVAVQGSGGIILRTFMSRGGATSGERAHGAPAQVRVPF